MRAVGHPYLVLLSARSERWRLKYPADSDRALYLSPPSRREGFRYGLGGVGWGELFAPTWSSPLTARRGHADVLSVFVRLCGEPAHTRLLTCRRRASIIIVMYFFF